MKVALIILSVFAVANCYYVHPDNDIHYIPKLPKIPGLKEAVPSPLIVGGEEAVPHSRPFQVALYIDGLYFCGGTLISDKWVLTAGHCTTGAKEIHVVLGAHNLKIDEPSQVKIYSNGTNIHTHANYSAVTLHNDVGLLQLNHPVVFSAEIQAAPLPKSTDPDVGADNLVVVSGWGATSDTGSVNDVLKVATVSTVSNADCEEYYGALTITDATLCTSSASGDGTCFGDSGGPLTLAIGGETVHRAVTSFVASAGCQSGNYDGFTRSSHYRDWIFDISRV